MRSALLSSLVFVGMVVLSVLFGGCGDSACDTFVSKVCDECEHELNAEWKAACACHSNEGYVKAYGFHCKDPNEWDQTLCRIGLDLWNDHTCQMLNHLHPLERPVDDSNSQQ